MQPEYQTETAGHATVRAETFGTRLRRLRTERKISQDRFARMLGVSRPTVWTWERDDVRPRPKSLEAAASLLGVSERELIFSGGAWEAASDVRRATPQQLREVINACKEQIARAAGTSTEGILITIHV